MKIIRDSSGRVTDITGLGKWNIYVGESSLRLWCGGESIEIWAQREPGHDRAFSTSRIPCPRIPCHWAPSPITALVWLLVLVAAAQTP